MEYEVSVKAKNEFISYFLKMHQLKLREGVWLLNFLKGNNSILKRVHFIDEKPEYCPVSILLTERNKKGPGFRFFTKGKVSGDPEKAFDFIRKSDEGTEVYLCIDFKDSNGNLNWISVLEDNPFIPNERRPGIECSKEIDDFLLDLEGKGALNRIEEKINKSLEKRTERTFKRLSKQYNSIVEELDKRRYSVKEKLIEGSD